MISCYISFLFIVISESVISHSVISISFFWLYQIPLHQILLYQFPFSGYISFRYIRVRYINFLFLLHQIPLYQFPGKMLHHIPLYQIPLYQLPHPPCRHELDHSVWKLGEKALFTVSHVCSRMPHALSDSLSAGFARSRIWMGGAGFAEQETFEVASIPLPSRSLPLWTENSISSKAIPMNSIRSANGAEKLPTEW